MRIVWLLFLSVVMLHAIDATDMVLGIDSLNRNRQTTPYIDQSTTVQKIDVQAKLKTRRTQYRAELKKINTLLEQDNIWINAQEDYIAYRVSELELAQIKARIQVLSIHENEDNEHELLKLNKEKNTLLKRLENLDSENRASFLKMLDEKKIDIRFDAAEFVKYESELPHLEKLILLLNKKKLLLEQLILIDQKHDYSDDFDNVTLRLKTFDMVKETIVTIQEKRSDEIEMLNIDLEEIKGELEKDSIWQKSYDAYLSYLQVKRDLVVLHDRIENLVKVGDSIKEKDELALLTEKEKILSDQLSLLKGHGISPFANLIKPEDIEEEPEINDPIDIFTGISYKKHIRESYQAYVKRGKDLQQIMILLRKKIKVLKYIQAIDQKNSYRTEIDETSEKLERFTVALGTLQSTENVYGKRIEEIDLQIQKRIEKQIYKLFNIGIIILVLFLLSFLVKLGAKKYITDNERFYMSNKIITFTNVTLIILILLFNYIENVNYLVTVLGFASAGIAIAMKDWFMSMLGWLVIVFGGSIHVGDRVRVDKDGMLYVGDVLDISLLRITILEDITLTTYLHNRRAGRIIFIPNNYVFTTMIANYTHVSLKTVWDGIDITITFDSNHKKAMHITKDVARKYAKGYTDITRKQLNKLRHRYSLKNTNVEPRVFSFIEENGIRISTWYLTNAYATLTLRSTISMEIIDAFKNEDDITIAYPTQKLHLSGSEEKRPPFDTEEAII